MESRADGFEEEEEEVGTRGTEGQLTTALSFTLTAGADGSWTW